MDVTLKPATPVEESSSVFGPNEETAIVSLAFDQPEFFSSIMPYITPDYFDKYESQYVFSLIKYHMEKNEVILSRAMCRDIALDELTADDPHEEILTQIARESDPREVPILTDKLMEWAKRKAMMQLYEQNVIDEVERGEFETVDQIIENARRITDIGSECHFFFNELDPLFIKENEEKFTTGFKTLDMAVNEGGPARGEVFCWMAPTGVGKSIALINMAVACVRRGLNVLFVTLEMPWMKVALRFMGCFTKRWIRRRFLLEDEIRKSLSSTRNTYNSELIISEFPPDEISVDHIHAQIDMLRKIHGVKIDVVVIDYLELMMSRNPAYNKEDYTRQKRVGTEMMRMASKENVLVATATQSNRAGVDGADKEKVLDLNKVAESFGKTMPVSYLVTINQTKQEYDAGRSDSTDPLAPVENAQCRFYLAKNRNGPKFMTINAKINYETMAMTEYESLTAQNESEEKDDTLAKAS
jgi:replicative DNA helicase